MTWAEFKSFVDNRIADMGKDDTISICYTEVNYPTEHTLDVDVDDNTLTIY